MGFMSDLMLKVQCMNKAKKILERQVYQDHRLTLYCEAKFDAKMNLEAPVGFVTTTHLKRAKKIEWEHVHL